jgi:hypothetical protein
MNFSLPESSAGFCDSFASRVKNQPVAAVGALHEGGSYFSSKVAGLIDHKNIQPGKNIVE